MTTHPFWKLVQSINLVNYLHSTSIGLMFHSPILKGCLKSTSMFECNAEPVWCNVGLEWQEEASGTERPSCQIPHCRGVWPYIWIRKISCSICPFQVKQNLTCRKGHLSRDAKVQEYRGQSATSFPRKLQQDLTFRPAADTDCPCCRFEEEGGKPVLYVYEIQLESRCQGKGLGKFMMRMVELVAFQLGMSSVMLTVMQENSAALKLYTSLGYTEHSSSPPATVGDSPGYLILHKPIRRQKVAWCCSLHQPEMKDKSFFHVICEISISAMRMPGMANNISLCFDTSLSDKILCVVLALSCTDKWFQRSFLFVCNFYQCIADSGWHLSETYKVWENNLWWDANERSNVYAITQIRHYRWLASGGGSSAFDWAWGTLFLLLQDCFSKILLAKEMCRQDAIAEGSQAIAVYTVTSKCKTLSAVLLSQPWNKL